MHELATALRQLGHVVFEPAFEEAKVDYSDIPEEAMIQAKGAFIREHLSKIQRSDAVVLANYPKNGITGYVGANTLMEAAFAFALGKQIFVLNPIGEQSCRPEILGLGATIIDGDLSRVG